MKKSEKTNLLNEDVVKEQQQKNAQQSASAMSRIKGVIIMFLAMVLSSTSKICVQALDRLVPDFELNCIRCGFATVGMIFYFVITRHFPRVTRDKVLAVFLLCFVSNIVTIGIYVTLTFIPLASSECLILTSNLAAGLIIFTIINKEKLAWDKLVAVLVCIVGVLLILQPDFVFKSSDILRNSTQVNPNSTKLSSQRQSTEKFDNWSILGYILAVCTGICLTLEIAVVKYYKDFFTVENLFISLIWTHALGTLLSLIPMLIYEDLVFPVDVKNILLICGHVCFFVFMMPMLLYASLLIAGSLVPIIFSTGLIIVLIAQYTFLKDIHPGHRNWIEIAGVICVLFGSIFSSLIEIYKGCTADKNVEKGLRLEPNG